MICLHCNEYAARPCGVSEHWVLQQSMDAACSILRLASFKVSPYQAIALKNMKFVGGNFFDIGSCLLPFSITPSDATSTTGHTMLASAQVRPMPKPTPLT
jgi:hypothetical protein